MNNLVKDLIIGTKGRIFVCEFIKKDKSVRRMLCRLGVKRGLTGAGARYEKENLITVYDMTNKGFRNINIETVKSFKCGKVEWFGG